jgi:hypothetical protein
MLERIPKMEGGHTHELPEPSKDHCSCCRKPFVHGYQNVIKIDTTPTQVLGWEGQDLGLEGHARVKAYYHAECARLHYPGMGAVECRYCGVFCKATKLKDGTAIQDHCKCQCHKGKAVCLLLF